MKIKLDYAKVELLAKYKGVETSASERIKLSALCRRCGVNYNTMLNNRYKNCGIRIEDAWKLSRFLECPINDIIKVEIEEGDDLGEY